MGKMNGRSSAALESPRTSGLEEDFVMEGDDGGVGQKCHTVQCWLGSSLTRTKRF